MLRGLKLGKFRHDNLHRLLETSQAKRHGLTAEHARTLSPGERLAWEWAILNEKAMEDLAGYPSVKRILYDDLVLNPVPPPGNFSTSSD
jgi:hypothetical protein